MIIDVKINLESTINMTSRSPYKHGIQETGLDPHARLVIEIYKNMSLVLEAIRSEHKTQHISGQIASTMAKSREENYTFLYARSLGLPCLIGGIVSM